jgi:hypothetical protein
VIRILDGVDGGDGKPKLACRGGDVGAELMETVKDPRLGKISNAFWEVGGRYRRSI